MEIDQADRVADRLFAILEDLTGQTRPFDEEVPPKVVEILNSKKGSLGYSQLNEILLLFGYDRICPEFYQFIADGDSDFDPHTSIQTIAELEEGIEQFRKMAMLLYGNVKFAYKCLNSNPEILKEGLESMRSISAEDFADRHDPIYPIDYIEVDLTYLTGYITRRKIESAFAGNPDDPLAQSQKELMEQTVKRAEKNQKAYLASDHLDVYVATSMREQHEFVTTGQLINRIFSSEVLSPLKLRWFDPTQAVCDSRIDKGLAEALMLKRAMCTIYLAQESDTLGKDSELASTLAQGKTVIAYVPEVTEEYFEDYIRILGKVYSDQDLADTLLMQLQHIDESLAWNDGQVREWLDQEANKDTETIKTKLFKSMKGIYDRRANMLLQVHPLGIQVNLSTGVANGVLVARSEESLSLLVRDILTQELEFTLETDEEAVKLVEKRTKSVYRVMTHDQLLTNTFWNFYLNPA